MLLKAVAILLNIYQSFKALKPVENDSIQRRMGARLVSDRDKEVEECLSLWIILILWMQLESFVDGLKFPHFIPFYGQAKATILLWVIASRSTGSRAAIQFLIQPLIRPYEGIIDLTFSFFYELANAILWLILTPLQRFRSYLKSLMFPLNPSRSSNDDSQTKSSQQLVREAQKIVNELEHMQTLVRNQRQSSSLDPRLRVRKMQLEKAVKEAEVKAARAAVDKKAILPVRQAGPASQLLSTSSSTASVPVPNFSTFGQPATSAAPLLSDHSNRAFLPDQSHPAVALTPDTVKSTSVHPQQHTSPTQRSKPTFQPSSAVPSTPMLPGAFTVQFSKPRAAITLPSVLPSKELDNQDIFTDLPPPLPATRRSVSKSNPSIPDEFPNQFISVSQSLTQTTTTSASKLTSLSSSTKRKLNDLEPALAPSRGRKPSASTNKRSNTLTPLLTASNIISAEPTVNTRRSRMASSSAPMIPAKTDPQAPPSKRAKRDDSSDGESEDIQTKEVSTAPFTSKRVKPTSSHTIQDPPPAPPPTPRTRAKSRLETAAQKAHNLKDVSIGELVADETAPDGIGEKKNGRYSITAGGGRGRGRGRGRDHSSLLAGSSFMNGIDKRSRWISSQSKGEDKEYAFEIAASNLRFGPGVTAELGKTILHLPPPEGKTIKVGVFTDANVFKLPPYNAVAESLEASGIAFETWSDVNVEPTLESWQAAIDFSRQHDFTHFVAVGGGSSIDTAKAANLFVCKGDAEILDYVNAPVGKGLPVEGSLRHLIAIPTTAGTGSETTGTAILDIPHLSFKTGIASRAMKPTIGLIDTLHTKTCSRQLNVSAGLDTLFHALESYTAIPYNERTPRPADPILRPAYQGRNPISDVFSIWALKETIKMLPRVFRDSEGDDQARESMLLAAAFAGIGFGNAGVHLAHGASYPISSQNKAGPKHRYLGYNVPNPIIPHGVSVALSGPAVFEFTAPSSPDRHREIAALFEPSSQSQIDRLSDEAVGPFLHDALAKFLDALQIPRGLKQVGYKESDVDKLVDGMIPQARVINLAPGVGNVNEDEGREKLKDIITNSLSW